MLGHTYPDTWTLYSFVSPLLAMGLGIIMLSISMLALFNRIA